MDHTGTSLKPPGKDKGQVEMRSVNSGGGGRRQAIIAATIATIAEQGLRDTSIERITSRAGVSRGLARYHFKSKAELLQTVFRFVILEFQNKLEEGSQTGSARKRLSDWIRNTFTPVDEIPEMLPAWLALTEEARTDQKLQEISDEANRSYVEHLLPLVRNVVPSSADEEQVQRAVDGFIALTDGLWFSLCTAPGRLDAKYAQQICEDYIERLNPSS